MPTPFSGTVYWVLTGAQLPVWLPVWSCAPARATWVFAAAGVAFPPGKAVPLVQSAPMTRVSCEAAPCFSAEPGRPRLLATCLACWASLAG